MLNALSFGRLEEPPALVHYAVAVACAGFAAVVTHLAGVPLGSAVPAILAVLVASWYGGMLPAVLAWALSVLSIVSYFAVRFGTPGFEDRSLINNVPLITLFSITSLFGAWMIARQRKTSVSLRNARDELAAKLADLAKTNAALEMEVAERKRIEASLRESEARLNAFVGSIDEIVLEVDAEGRYLNVWTRNEDLLIRPRDELIGRKADEILPREDTQRRLATLRRVLVTGEPETFEAQLDSLNGRRWFLVQVNPITSPDGERRTVSCLLRDITERKRDEQRLAAQYGVTRALENAASLAEAAPDLLAAIGSSFAWDWGALWCVDKSGEKLGCETVWRANDIESTGFDSSSRALTLSPGDGRPGRVWQSAQPDWLSDLRDEPGFLRKDAAAEAGFRSGVAFPVVLGKEALAVIEFFTRESRDRDDSQLTALAAIGSQIGQFIKRQRAEEAVRASERELRDVIETIPVMAWSALPDGSSTFINRRWREYVGEGQPAIHPDDVSEPMEKVRASQAAGEPFEYELRFRRASDGQYRWFLARGVPLHDDKGKVIKWFGTLTDIDDLKTAESLLAGERSILEMVAKGESLASILSDLCLLVEEQTSDVLVSILLVEDGRLRHGAAPSLPREYNEAVDGLAIGPAVGSCGTAAYLGKPVVVSDIATDPLWAEYRDFALSHELHACWSTPITSSEGAVIGTFAMYHRHPKEPNPRDQALIEQITYLAGIAIQSKLAEQALRASERRYRNIFETAGVSIWEEDFSEVQAAIDGLKRDGVSDFAAYFAAHPEFVEQALAMVKIVDVNEATVKLFEAEGKEQLLPWLDSIFTAETFSAFVTELLAIAEGRTFFAAETLLQTLSGRKLDVFFTITFPEAPAKLNSVLVTLTDMTERKEAEQAVREAQAELARVARMTTLGELTASIAHEINQPLGAIVTNANAGLRWLNAEAPNIGEVRQTLTRIHRDANRAADVIGRIRSLARKTPLRSERLDINELVGDVVALTRVEMDRSRIKLRSTLGAGLPRVSGDRIQLQQVVLNLVVNAIEAMHEREPRNLEVATEQDGAGNVRVSVRDSGPGLDPATADRIFNSFFTTKSGGMGMGLSICRSIVERHGGSLSARTNEPHGAVFEFNIPSEAQAPAVKAGSP